MLNFSDSIFQKYAHLFDDSIKLLNPPTIKKNKLVKEKGSRPVEETVEALEAIQKEDLLPEIIRSEVNSLIYPIFALHTKDLDKIRKIEYRAVVQRDGKKLEISWKVAGHPEFGGYPGPFEKQVHRAIEKIINSFPLPIQNPIRLGSFMNIAKFMGLKSDKRGKFRGHVYKDIKDALRRIKTTTIESKGTFYHKGKTQWMEDLFGLYERVIFKGEELSDGTIADTNYLFLGSWYLESINARYVRPLDYTYLESLPTELTRRFYELFGTKFYFILKNNIPFIRYKYSTLCQLLPIVPQKYYSDAKKILNPSHQQLIKTGFFEKVIWHKKKISGNSPDWFIYYYPGYRAREEYQRHQDNYQITEGDLIQLAETNISEPSQLGPSNFEQEDLTSTQKNLLNQLIELGVTEKIAVERVKTLKPAFIKDWLEAVKDMPNLTDRPAYLVKALKENWSLPESYLKQKKQKEQFKSRQTQIEKREEEERQRQEKEREGLDSLYNSFSEEQKKQIDFRIQEKFNKHPFKASPDSPLYQSTIDWAKYQVLKELKVKPELMTNKA